MHEQAICLPRKLAGRISASRPQSAGACSDLEYILIEVSVEVDSVLLTGSIMLIANQSPDPLPLVHHVEAENAKRVQFTLRSKRSDRTSDERIRSLAVQASTPLIHPRTLLRDSHELKFNPSFTPRRDGTHKSSRKVFEVLELY